MPEAPEALVGRLFNAFNQRDVESMVEVCSPRMEFFTVTAEEIGRGAPYVGPEGLRDYLADAEQLWEELLITPGSVKRRGARMLVLGRVYVRNRELGIRDMPVAWIWQVEGGLFVRGEVFADPIEAVDRFAQAAT
jgi:ketosteroid isomerase-like protein